MKINSSLSLLLWSAQLGIRAVAEAAYNGTENSTVAIFPLSSDSQFSFLLTEVLALANGGGAATSEVLRAASQIVPGDFNSWFDEFNWLGEQIHALALEAKSVVSRREALFRSSSYRRVASFFLIGNTSDSRLYDSYNSALDDFAEAISLLPVPGEKFVVHGPGYDIPGYFYKAQAGNCTKLPTIVVTQGYDGNQENAWHGLGREAFDRGYNYVTFEGPGQPTVRRQQKIGFVADWWNVVSPVVDYISTRDDVDTDKLALIGLSFGGQLVPRVAAHEHRFKAILSIDGLVDIQTAIISQIGTPLASAFKAGNATQFNGYVQIGLNSPSTPTAFKWVVNQGKWAFDTLTWYDWLKVLGTFAATQEEVNNVTAQAWVGRGEGDTVVGGQETTLVQYFNTSGNPATLQSFPNDLGAGLHCQLGAEPYLAQRAFEWLDGVLSD